MGTRKKMGGERAGCGKRDHGFHNGGVADMDFAERNQMEVKEEGAGERVGWAWIYGCKIR